MQVEEREENTFLDVSSNVGENFTDYLLIVRKKDGSLRWKNSDTIWSLGATQAFQDRAREGLV